MKSDTVNLQPPVQGSHRHLLRRLPRPVPRHRQHRAARARLVHQLPRPSRYFLHHPRREGDRQVAGNGVMTAAGEPWYPPRKRGSRFVASQAERERVPSQSGLAVPKNTQPWSCEENSRRHLPIGTPKCFLKTTWRCGISVKPQTRATLVTESCVVASRFLTSSSRVRRMTSRIVSP